MKKNYTHQFKMPANKKASICWHFSIFCLYSYLQPEWSVWFLSIVCSMLKWLNDLWHKSPNKSEYTKFCDFSFIILFWFFLSSFQWSWFSWRMQHFHKKCNIFVMQEIKFIGHWIGDTDTTIRGPFTNYVYKRRWVLGR